MSYIDVHKEVWNTILHGETSKLRLLLYLHTVDKGNLSFTTAWILSCMFVSKNKLDETLRILKEYNLFTNEKMNINIIEIVFKYQNFSDIYTKPSHIDFLDINFNVLSENIIYCKNKNSLEFLSLFEDYLNKEKDLHYVPMWRRKKIFHRDCFYNLNYIKKELENEFVQLPPEEMV